MKFLICIGWLCISLSVNAQSDSAISSSKSDRIIHYSTAYNDSVYALLIKIIPKSNRAKFKEFFEAMTDEDRSLFYVMNLPVSSKKELIQNVDTNYRNIQDAIVLFKKFIPSEMEVYIEFKPPEILFKKGESIDIWCSRNTKSGDKTPLFQKWNVELSSKELDSLLTLVSMNRTELGKLHVALLKAHCISIANRDPIEIGFARSGMGKYSYLFFDHPLTDTEMKLYNNGCEYIFYKDNIVLEYGAGAIGSLCFPYEEPE